MIALPPLTLHPIGVVHSPLRRGSSVEPWGVPAEIHLDPQQAAGLTGLERSSHLFVLGFLHRARRDALLARPRRLAPEAPPLGVFACRSPARPNPISLTVCRLVTRHGTILQVDHLDLLDGTPVLDLKPYNPGWDDVSSATRVRRVEPEKLTDHQLMACLARALDAHLGDVARTVLARRGLGAVFLAVRELGLDPRDPRISAIVGQLDGTADAVIGLLGATFGSGRIRLLPGALGLGFAAGEQGLLLRPSDGDPPFEAVKVPAGELAGALGGRQSADRLESGVETRR